MQYDDPAGRLTPFEYECLIKHSCFLMNSRSNGEKTAEKGGEMSDTPRTDAATHTEEGQEWLQEDAYRLHELSKQLERELSAAQKDAERYRWLRDVVEGSDAWNAANYIIECPTDEWDAAIDAAIATEKRP